LEWKLRRHTSASAPPTDASEDQWKTYRWGEIPSCSSLSTGRWATQQQQQRFGKQAHCNDGKELHSPIALARRTVELTETAEHQPNTCDVSDSRDATDYNPPYVCVGITIKNDDKGKVTL
jgi:hypothetical protein